MSKSKGNVVNPDEFVQKYGADAVRVYLAFIGPYNEPRSYPWNLDGVAAMRKFLERVVRLVEECGSRTSTSDVDVRLPQKIEQVLARTSAKVAEDGDRFKFNTAVAALMILVNELETLESIPKVALMQMVTMLAPFAPHLAEHLWAKLSEGKSPDASSDEASREKSSVHQQSWPIGSITAESEVEVVVQVAGRRRGSIMLPRENGEAEAVIEAMKIPAVLAALAGKEPKRVVYVAGKIINLVV